MNMLEFAMVLVSVSTTALVCGIFIGHKIGSLNMTGRDPFPEDEDTAAAPGMLEALETIMDEVGESYLACRSEVEAAIAKAKGGIDE